MGSIVSWQPFQKAPCSKLDVDVRMRAGGLCPSPVFVLFTKNSIIAERVARANLFLLQNYLERLLTLRARLF